MAEFANRYPQNAPGRFYVDANCTDCDLCRELAPNNVRRSDRMAFSYVYKQPENQSEINSLMQGVKGCPTDAVGYDGDDYDWEKEPIMDWNGLAKRWGLGPLFDISVPIIPEEEPEHSFTSLKVEIKHVKNWWKKRFP